MGSRFFAALLAVVALVAADSTRNDFRFSILGDRTGDLAALEAAGLPALSTPAELALAMGLSAPRLRWLAFHAEAATRVHYVEFEVPKKGGGTRRLSAPHHQISWPETTSARRWRA